MHNERREWGERGERKRENTILRFFHYIENRHMESNSNSKKLTSNRSKFPGCKGFLDITNQARGNSSFKLSSQPAPEILSDFEERFHS